MTLKPSKRICYLASSRSTHIKKWCKYFIEKGHEVHVISFDVEEIDGVNVHHINRFSLPLAGDFGKLTYLTSAMQVSRIIKEINPDIVHAHYATSYGAVAALACDRPYYLSVWGSDVYDFPNKSVIHKAFLKWVLKKASYILSTSHAMSDETRKYTTKEILVTPFGVDMRAFHPKTCSKNDSFFTTGTVKALESKYGIDVLLRGCAMALDIKPDLPLKIRIAGSGSDEVYLKQYSQKLGLKGRIEWLGYVDQSQVPDVWRSLNLAIIPSESESESFGVSAVEAQACGIPVIVSDIPGLMEATSPGESSIVVKRGDSAAIARAIVDFYNNNQMRLTMGRAGREFVCANYEIGACFVYVEDIYDHHQNKEKIQDIR